MSSQQFSSSSSMTLKNRTKQSHENHRVDDVHDDVVKNQKNEAKATFEKFYKRYGSLWESLASDQAVIEEYQSFLGNKKKESKHVNDGSSSQYGGIMDDKEKRELEDGDSSLQQSKHSYRKPLSTLYDDSTIDDRNDLHYLN